MKSGIATGGYERFKRAQEDVAPEIKKKKRVALEKKYAQLIAARPHEKERLYEKMAKELLLLDHEPSAAALW